MLEEAKVLKIEKIKNKLKKVYDLEVADNNNFFANNILVHNSATPYREDGKTNYIMALTGFPVGLDWKTIMEILGKEYHTVNVHVVKDTESKYALVKQLYNPERRTLFFVNLLDVGKRLSEMFSIPFISGETKNRLGIVKNTKSFVASRVLELGVSIKDLEHIIEVDFLFGSRREEMQRTGRLIHSVSENKIHDIIFTKEELESYGKRLYSLYEKGFRYNLIPHLSGVFSGDEIKIKKRAPPSTRSSVNYLRILEDLYKEGYFQTERVFVDVCKSAARRGVGSSPEIKQGMHNKLANMVKSGKLYKIESDGGYGGYKYKQR